jgi:N-acetyl-anhydromuramyl-L-alanine amidase AmpD
MGILDTDMFSQFDRKQSIKIETHYLPESEYLHPTADCKNEYLFLHHTAGWNNPFATIKDWAKDDRGEIATEFCIGGQNIKTGDTTYDGRIVQAFPTGGQGWHLGPTGSLYMSKHSVGIEVCNFGWLTDSLKTYTGTEVLESQICRLTESFKGYSCWQKYSDAQLKSLKELILFVAQRDGIDINKGILEFLHKGQIREAFAFNEQAYNGDVKGMLFHCNVRKDKYDMFPQPELIDMLLSL